MIRPFSKKSIPLPEWIARRILFFNTMKTDITSSPVTTRFSTKKTMFLKTDWSASGMGLILMQTDGSKESSLTMAKLVTGEDKLFDTAITGARLRPICFGFRTCDPNEEHYHSYVGKYAAGRLASSSSSYTDVIYFGYTNAMSSRTY
jgi:hypothetical protein